MSSRTPPPWVFEPGGGHAPNRIVGSESVQILGWLKPRGGIRNASYSTQVCENLGDTELPAPAANVRLIVAAPEMLENLKRAYHELNTIAARDGVPYTYQGFRSSVSEEYFQSLVEDIRALLARIDGED